MFRICSLMIHTDKHSAQELILNKDVFNELTDGDYIYIYDIEKPLRKLVLKVVLSIVKNLEISLLKSVADHLNVKAFSKVRIEKVSSKEAEVDFVELSFKKQFLQRGNLWRFKNSLPVGMTIHVGGYFNIDGINAQVQEIGKSGSEITAFSGIITENTHFIFRSRSTRIIWLVQISKEMFECDQNGDLYFEKFLLKFVEPLIDQWKSMGVSHLLSVIFFARTLYPASINPCLQTTQVPKPQFKHIKHGTTLGMTRDGIFFNDYFKTAIDSITEYDKKSIVRTLKEELWAFPEKVGWNIDGCSPVTSSQNELYGVPSDAPGGNFLEAINSTLNFLDKHFIDRDLQRTGNSIVMISAGTGIFRVKPTLQQITKQRMMDNGIGMDFISLSQPPLHTVPLFLIECEAYSISDFYEVPHWMNVTYVDCDCDPSAPFKNSLTEEQKRKLRDVTDPDNIANPRWTGLEPILSADEEAGGKLIVSGGFLQYVPPEANKCIGRKFEATDIWRDVNEFQPLPFANVISGFAHASDAADGHIRSIPPFLKRHIQRFTSRGSTSSTSLQGCGQRTEIHPWGHINFAPSSQRSSDAPLEPEEGYRMDGFANVFALPTLPLDKHGEGLSTLDRNESFIEEKASSYTEPKTLHMASSVLRGSSFDDKKTQYGEWLAEDSYFGNSKVRAHVHEVSETMRKISNGGKLSREEMAAYDASAVAFSFGVDDMTVEIVGVVSSSEEKGDRRKRLGSYGNQQRANLSSASLHSTKHEDASHAHSLEKESTPRQRLDSALSRSSSPFVGNMTPLKTSMTDPSLNASTHTPSRAALARDKNQRQHQSVSLPSELTQSGETQPRDFIRFYRRKYHINPFKREEGKAFLETRTHNRRRWSHVFPAYSLGRQENANAYFGLNKKSLTQPAILPMTTDYVPSAKDILAHFDIHSGYSLSICNYNSLQNLVIEMICQRLSVEFQLVEGYIPEDYAKLSQDLKDKSTFMKNSKCDDGSQMYILSMGHRIHLVIFDARGHGEIVVTRFLSKRGTNSSNTYDKYMFEVWVPHTKQFQTVTQKFCQYPEPEFAWNKADDLVLGNQELDTDYPKFIDQPFTARSSEDVVVYQPPLIKSRKLCFFILPPECIDNVDEYMTKVELLLQHLQRGENLGKTQVKAISDSSMLASLGKAVLFPIVYKLFLRDAAHPNPKWIYVRLDGLMDIRRTFHIQIHWMVCDSWLLEDYIAVLFRRCSTWGLKLLQTPEYFRTSNLQIHPYRPLPRINIPFSSPLNFGSCVVVAEKLFFVQNTKAWIFDGAYLTDWKNLGLEPPQYSFGEDAIEAKSASPFSALTNILRPRSDRGSRPQRIPDGQYVHRSGYASVRLGPEGFVWMPNMAPRTSETNTSIEERRESATATLRELESFCEACGICYSLLTDLVDNCLSGVI